MADFLEEYKAYYKVREERYANNPNYTNAYAAEQELSNAMQSCNALEEFREKVGDLPDKCAFGLMRDEYLMERKHYTKHEEPHRKSISDQVLAGLPNCSDVQDAITLSLDANNAGSKAIIADEYHREFISALWQLDQLEIYANAEVPDHYKSDFQSHVAEEKQRMVEAAQNNESEFRKFIPGWTERPETCMENRHKRLIPYRDEHAEEKLAIYKNIINR